MISSTILTEPQTHQSPKYPYLGISKEGNIVLFVSPGRGTLLRKGSVCSLDVGDYYDHWHESNFTPLVSPLLMENKNEHRG